MDTAIRVLKVHSSPAPVLIWSGDEMEIRCGLSIIKSRSEIVGLVSGAIAEKDIATVDENKISEKVARKVMMIHLTTIDGSACIPLAFIPSTTISAEQLFAKVSLFNLN